MLLPSSPENRSVSNTEPAPSQRLTAILSAQSVSPAPHQVDLNPDRARELMHLPDIEAPLEDLAREISTYLPLANKEYMRLWRIQHQRQLNTSFEPRHGPSPHQGPEPMDTLPRFEKVFRLAASYAGMPNIEQHTQYDSLLVLCGWVSTKGPGDSTAFFSSYPKAVLCTHAHSESPQVIENLSSGERDRFHRRAPAYLRYLLLHRLKISSCAELERANLRLLMKSNGFRLVEWHLVPEVAFPGITAGADPAVRPWYLREPEDRDMVIRAAVHTLQHRIRAVEVASIDGELSNTDCLSSHGCTTQIPLRGLAIWDLKKLKETPWDEVFAECGAGSYNSRTRFPDIRACSDLLRVCIAQIGAGNIIGSELQNLTEARSRISLDRESQIFEKIDQITARVLLRAEKEHPELFLESGKLDPRMVRKFRKWNELYERESTNILNELGVPVYLALSRISPETFGTAPGLAKSWELEMEHGKWDGPRGKRLLRSAYANALLEAGLGHHEPTENGCMWRCSQDEFNRWYKETVLGSGLAPSEFLARLAESRGLTPLMNSVVSHPEGASLLAGQNVHSKISTYEHRWAKCMIDAIKASRDSLSVPLDLSPRTPFPFSVREALLKPVPMPYLHPTLAFVRPHEVALIRSGRILYDLPNWLEDYRPTDTPLADRLNNASSDLLALMNKVVEFDMDGQISKNIRFHTLQILALHTEVGKNPNFTDKEVKMLLELTRQCVLPHSNALPSTTRFAKIALTRLIARESFLSLVRTAVQFVGQASGLESKKEVRNKIALDVVDDAVLLTLRAICWHHAMMD